MFLNELQTLKNQGGWISQSYCEKKTLEGAQEQIDSNGIEMTKDSIDSLEKHCNTMCTRKMFKAYQLQNRIFSIKRTISKGAISMISR